ncbi:putative E3 ubiquitin-protein ligase RING1a [Miscanthus floridulus]|uniref:putative E3 ubiquitin-protein ligase RING1a n=1 Tax=Miscanthus floridulus TaxID=154761 RepID=UPI00345A60F3
MGTAAPAMMPMEDLEGAIAELPAKKDALREAFDSLAACSPYPLPFTWEDLDAHVSSVQSSISRRFRQLRALEVARPGSTSKNKEGANEVEEEEVEEEEEEVVVEEEEEEEVEEEEEEEVVEEEEEEEEVEEEEEEEDEEEDDEEEENDKQMKEADDYIGNQAKEDKEGGKDNKRKQDADEEAVRRTTL